MNVDRHGGQTGSLLGRLARGVGSAWLVTFEQVVVAALVFACLRAEAWAQLVTLVLAAAFVIGLRAARA